jgi:hypothetical protein
LRWTEEPIVSLVFAVSCMALTITTVEPPAAEIVTVCVLPYPPAAGEKVGVGRAPLMV